MPFATGPWHTANELPDEGRTICLVQVRDRYGVVSHHAMRCVRYAWQFENGGKLSSNLEVVRWAYITDSVESRAELEPLPAEEYVAPADRDMDVHERALLLAAFVTELKGEINDLHEQIERSKDLYTHHTNQIRKQASEQKREARAKAAEIQKQYEQLLVRYKNLESRYRELHAAQDGSQQQHLAEHRVLVQRIDALKQELGRQKGAQLHKAHVLDQKKEIKRLIAVAAEAKRELEACKMALYKQTTRLEQAEQKIRQLQMAAV